MHQGAWDRLGVWSGAFESALDSRLHCSAGDPFAVAADKQCGSRRPSRQNSTRAVLFALGNPWKRDRATGEVCLDHRFQFGLDENAAFLAALPLNVDDGSAVVGGAESPTSA